ncbi:MAG: hypothetical protein HZA82_07350 [Thaumarchaeota archaeon]|nr:hypothetical protein [Nitrososphaerota archaeon]
MRKTVSTGIAFVALILILVYGFDILFTIYFEKTFLPFDTQIRGIIIGIPAAVLPILAFFLSRKIKSNLIGVLVFSTGIIMMSGSLAAATFIDQGVSDLESFGKNIASLLPVVGLGMFIIILGISKLND